MRRRFFLLVALAALVLSVRPQIAAACSMLPVPPDQQARAVQDTIARASVIAQGTVVGARPIAVDGRYYQQLTLDVTTSWRGASATQVTVVGSSLSGDISLASTIGVFTGNAPSATICSSSPRTMARAICASRPPHRRATRWRRPSARNSARGLLRRPRHRRSRFSSYCSARSPRLLVWRSSECDAGPRSGFGAAERGAGAVAVAWR